MVFDVSGKKALSQAFMPCANFFQHTQNADVCSISASLHTINSQGHVDGYDDDRDGDGDHWNNDDSKHLGNQMQ